MVNVDRIDVVDRIIDPTKARIAAMVKSLSGPLGQIEPIIITKHLYSSWKVVAGATRLLAAKELGWEQIEATIIGADNGFEYQLIEIAENLDRYDLSDDERAKLRIVESDLFEKRKAFFAEYLAEHPEITTTKAKGGRGKKGGVRAGARDVGVSESTARRQANKLRHDQERRSLPETPEPDGVATQIDEGTSGNAHAGNGHDTSGDADCGEVKRNPEPEKTLYCSFCGKSQHEVRKLIAGPTVFVCDECVALCIDIIREENNSSKLADAKAQRGNTPNAHFLLRANEALTWAEFKGKIDDRSLNAARATAQAWCRLAEQMESAKGAVKTKAKAKTKPNLKRKKAVHHDL